MAAGSQAGTFKGIVLERRRCKGSCSDLGLMVIRARCALTVPKNNDAALQRRLETLRTKEGGTLPRWSRDSVVNWFEELKARVPAH
jgi:hypothetical protein